MAHRKAIPLKTQLAAALLQLVDGEGHKIIPYPDSKLMTADQIVSLFELDHFPLRKADGGGDEPSNLHWRLRSEHRAKTAKIDLPQMAKQRRIRKREIKHGEYMGLKALGYIPTPTSKRIPSRPFPKGRKFSQKQV